MYHYNPKLTIKSSFGIYNQYISKIASRTYLGMPREYWILADNSISSGISSRHFILGSTYKNNNFVIDVEGYYKTYDNIVLYHANSDNRK